MKWLLRKITNGLTSVKEFLIPFGAAGLFAIALLDSALIPLPGGPDAVMLLLSTQSPARMPFYALGVASFSLGYVTSNRQSPASVSTGEN